MSWVASLIGAVGSGISSFFGFKKEQGEAVQQAIKVVGDVNASEATREQAIATIIAAEAQSSSPLTRIVRPLVFLVLTIDLHILIYTLVTGTFPDVLMQEMPPIVDKLLDIVTMCLGGYIGARSLEKIVDKIGIASVLKSYISKKLG